MAALSFFSNWGCSSLDHHQVQLKSDSLSFHQQQQQQQAQSQPQLSANNIEQLVYATNEYSLNNNYLTPLLPNIMCSNPSDYNLLSYSPESYYFANFEDHDYESFCYPKRHKVNENHCPISVDHDTTSSHLFDGCVQNYPNFMPDDQFVPIDAILPEDEADYHQYIAPIVFDNSSYDHQNSKDLNKPKKVLSAQSIAARQRRRKITEKTQELGKLIPGGNKMNTAEMFQAASKYVKFLQSQVFLLQLMASFQEEKKEEAKEIQGLKILASPIIQEKLYTEEMCLAPKKLLETLTSDDDIQSKPFLKDNIHQLLMEKPRANN